jgi:hypothetical protein
VSATPAVADTAQLPHVGELLSEVGTPAWPKMDWMYDAPNPADLAGKVVVHWFCGIKVKECKDDLARLVALRDAGKVYVIAYLDATKAQVKQLDPINGSEGVGRGTLAWGRGPIKLMKDMGIKGPMSVVVDVDGKIAMVSQGSTATDFDARDAKVNELITRIKDYTWSANDPKTAAPNDKFQLAVTVKLAPWLHYSTSEPITFAFTQLPRDVKCDATKLAGDQIKVDGQTATATVSCSAPFGSYEARGEIHFSYIAPAGGTGLGTEGAGWKIVVK